jgi:tight adherence protein C
MITTPLIITMLAFVTTVLLVMALMPQRRTALQARLAPYGARPAPARERLLATSIVERVLAPSALSLIRLAGVFAPSTIRAKAAAELAAAGDPMTVEQYLALRTAAMIGAPLLYWVYATRTDKASELMTVVFMGVLFLAGSRLSSWLVRKKRDKRVTEVQRALPSALDLITISMEAGLSFDSGLAKVVEKTKGTLSDEFGRVLTEMQMGKVRRDALRDMAKRVNTRDVTSFVASIVQADQMGMSLGPVMRAQSDDVRLRRRQRAEETAMKAPIKMLFPLMFCILPSTILVVLGPGLVTIGTQLLPAMSAR